MTGKAIAEADDLRVSLIEDASDFKDVFDCSSRAFGKVHDVIYSAIHPYWDTSQGAEAGAARMAQRWRSVTNDKNGRPNTLFLKATLPDPDRPGQRRIVGVAVWAQLSVVPGHGEVPSTTLGTPEEVEAMYKGDEALRRFGCQAWASLMGPRAAYVKEKASADPPAVFALELCAVDPDYWRRGIAQKLTEWGLDEAKRRGLEATTEASVMGRHVYLKLGFKPVAEIEYVVDQDALNGRHLPSNLFMRTG